MYPENGLEKMRQVIENCMGDAPPYCEATCPLHTDVKGYVNLIAEGKYPEAARLIREKLFLPATLGRICAHPCEEKCKRGDLKHPMSIAALKRFAARYDDPEKWDLAIGDDKGLSVAVIGAGPAGAQAALDLRKKGYAVTVYEKLPVVGGMLRVGIPEYRLPREIIDSEYSYLEKLGVTFRLGTEIGKDLSWDQVREEHDAVLIAVGSHKSVMIPIPGVDLEGVIPAVDLLRVASLARSYPVGRKVAVIGGGNVAIDAARTLRRIGAGEVHLYCLEKRDEMPAHCWEVEEAEEEGVIMHCCKGPAEILGKDGKVTGMAFHDCLSVFNEEGRFAPVCDTSRTEEIPFDNVVMAIGQSTDSSFLPEESTPRPSRREFRESSPPATPSSGPGSPSRPWPWAARPPSPSTAS